MSSAREELFGWDIERERHLPIAWPEAVRDAAVESITVGVIGCRFDRRRTMNWITATDLKNWAGTVIGRYQLSELVSALVRATAKDISRFRFPTGDSAQLPGYDGILEAQIESRFTPAGLSVWEFGTNEDPQAKATEDYKKRTAKPGAVNPTETTFVFVTPRAWPQKDEWVQARLAEGKWTGVRVIDGVDLEAWLDENPGVAASLATQTLKTLPTGVVSVDAFWDEYSARTSPPLTEQVLLAGREQEAGKIRQSLGGPPRGIVVRADSREEALAFVVAAIRTADADARKFLNSKTLIAANASVGRALSTHERLIIGIQQDAGLVSGLLVQKGNLVIVPLGNDAPNHKDAVVLARPSRDDFAKSLETMGKVGDEAERLARECGRSVTVLQRRAPAVTFQSPAWRDREDARAVLVPALMAGSWDGASAGDRTVLEQLSQLKYDEFEAKLLPLLGIPDSPIPLCQ